MATLTMAQANKVRKDAKDAVHLRHKEKIITIARLVYSASMDITQFQGGLRSLYIAWDYTSVEEWGFKELGLEPSEVLECRELWKLFGISLQCRKHNWLMTLLARVSFERLSIIRHVITTLRDARKWLTLAPQLSLSDLKKEAKKARQRSSIPSGIGHYGTRGPLSRIDNLRRMSNTLMQKFGCENRLELLETVFKHSLQCP